MNNWNKDSLWIFWWVKGNIKSCRYDRFTHEQWIVLTKIPLKYFIQLKGILEVHDIIDLHVYNEYF